ncbi:MAG: TonB-dependent receptor [Algicola sp.]|nr:TonB-dependent receptor [Algicola sp.]
MKQFKPSLLTLSLFAAGLSFACMPNAVYAEDAQAEPTVKLSKKEKDDKAQKEKAIEAISIKGFRGSVIKSLNTKRYSDTVVDAISADDIGGLPDVSIADSLTRLPGVTSIRIDGQSSELNIRGLSGGFVFSTLNGREQVSSAGGRSVQFDQFPSELIKQAQVYKSQKASLIEGGVAGTIELQTASALDNEEDTVFRFSAHGNWNEDAADNKDSESFGHRLTGSYQTKLMDETVGLSFGYARMFQPTVSSRFVNYKFEKTDLSATYDGGLADTMVSNGFEINQRGGEDTRDAFSSALNWVLTDDLSIQADLFYSDFKSKKWDRGLRVNGLRNIENPGSGILLTNPVFADGALIGGTFTRDPNGDLNAAPFGNINNMTVQTQADDNSTNSNVFSWGIKADWQINDSLSMTMDLSHSEADETYKDRVLRMAVFEDSSAATPIIDDNVIMAYQLDGLNMPTVSFNQDFTDLSKMMVTSAESYPHIEENVADALRLDFKYELDNDHLSSFETGLRVSKREYTLDRGRFLYGSNDYAMRNGNYIVWGRDEEGNLFEIERFTPYQLTDGNSSSTSIGGDLGSMPDFLTVDNTEILNGWIPGVDQTPIKNWDHSWTLTQGNKVEEEVIAAYFQANLDTELFGLPMTGNIGLRVINSDQKSTGLINVGAGNGDIIADDRGVTENRWSRLTKGTSYTDYLPSMNLNFSITENDQLRFAYAKVMARADMSDLANSGNFQYVNDPSDGYVVNLDSRSSPFLRPFYANQIDISFEHYLPDSDGAIVIALWNKDIQNFVGTTKEKNFDYAAAGIDVPPPTAQFETDNEGNVIDWQNGTYTHAENNADAGYIRGVEIAYTQTFKFLPGLWSGLGANINFSYTESEITIDSKVPGNVDANGDPLPGPIEGLSPRVISATLFYDYDETFSARISARHRAAYLSEQIAVGDSEAAYFEKETIISAQVSYNFTENLQAVMSMDNITDEANISYFINRNNTGTIQNFGRTLYFGVNYKM